MKLDMLKLLKEVRIEFCKAGLDECVKDIDVRIKKLELKKKGKQMRLL